MPFAFRTNRGAQMLLTANPTPPFTGISTLLDLIWDAGELGSRDRPTLNYEFNKTVKVKVK